MKGFKSMIEKQNNDTIGNKVLLENRQKEITEKYKANAQALALMEIIDTQKFETNHAEVLTVELSHIDNERNHIQISIDNDITTQRNLKYNKKNICSMNKVCIFMQK